MNDIYENVLVIFCLFYASEFSKQFSLFSYFLLHMFFQVFNREIADLPDELLNSLNLIPDLLTESKAANTVKKYYNGFRRWKSWALSHQIPECDILPSKPFHVALY